MPNGAFAALFVAAVLLFVIFAVLGAHEKDRKKKFRYELLACILLGMNTILVVIFLTQGFYFHHSRFARRIISAGLMILMFLAYADKTYENWKAMKSRE